jgi:hypothetical protein
MLLLGDTKGNGDGMSDLAKRLEVAHENVVETQAKILTFDIERTKGQANIEFWDLGDYKNRRIHADSVVEWPRSICVAWNWYGKDKIKFASEWDDGREGFLTKIWEQVDKAEIVVGHNIVGFDLKKLNSEWRDLGLNPPSPYRVVDTLKEARKQFGDESKTLDALCKRIGLTSKSDRYDAEVAKRALAGERADQIKLQSYNEGDIVATLELYDRLRGWMPGHPHIGPLDGETNKCNQCGGTNLARNGTYLAIQIRYIQYRCTDCGANLRGATHSRSAMIRGVK